jgi:hypothetical protein
MLNGFELFIYLNTIKNIMAFCSGCGKELPSPDADVCTHCGRLVKEQVRSSYFEGSNLRKERSGWWYIVPILFSIIGGIIAYLIVKDDDPKLAKNCLIIGIILFVIGLMLIPFVGL